MVQRKGSESRNEGQAMADTIQAGITLKRLVRRLAIPLMAVAFVVCVVIIALQIADDFNGYITALVSCILALAALRPICENIWWALRVIFGLPIKAGAKASGWLWPDETTGASNERSSNPA